MSASEHRPFRGLDQDIALRSILEGTATETGERFFAALVRNVALALGTHGAWVTEYLESERRLRAMAFWMDGDWLQDYEVDIAGTPCERVIDEGRLVHFPDRLLDLFGDDPDVLGGGFVSYMGMPLLDDGAQVLGHLAVIDRRPMPADPRAEALFRIFAARATAEMQRLRREQALREREEQLARLVGSAMDAIIQLEGDLSVVLMNPAAERILSCRAAAVAGSGFGRFLTESSRIRLGTLIAELDSRSDGERSLWIGGGLTAVAADGREFAAEATLSRAECRRRTHYTLILRDVNERLEAERRIQSLECEAAYLREEIKALHDFEDIIGHSPALRRVLLEMQQVAGTNATVLIQGETGTGKELFARAVHAASPRRDKALIKVNCAAVPAALIESEFFGHEKGAFTGATSRREGRFALADGGTLFLDEVGELPLDLQAKLLRVLQEGEFEPVGSNRTRRVDVRVIAATNRDLAQEVERGGFREDLYYRLNVFPIRVPPLRERMEDVETLAQVFARRAAQRLGRRLQPLDPASVRRLQAYAWPGNVRELENVMERAAITAQDGRLDLDRALPGTAATPAAAAPPGPAEVLTVRDLQALERQNLLRALEAAHWRVAGEQGAARLLGIAPSTLASRMKALGIRRPPPL